MTALARTPSYAVVVACGFGLAVFLPLVLGRPDSFPLSTYPMFAQHRGQPEMVKLVAITAEGPVSVRPGLLGTGEVLQAKVLLDQVARKGREARNRFCTSTAARLADLPETLSWQELQLVRAKFDPIQYFHNDGQPISAKRLARCAMRPPPSNDAPVDADNGSVSTREEETP